MNQEQINRINQLARKSKTPEGLTAEEAAEQAALRRAYIDAYKLSFRQQLESIVVQDETGAKRKLRPKA